jgi:hypothetical protein
VPRDGRAECGIERVPRPVAAGGGRSERPDGFPGKGDWLS